MQETKTMKFSKEEIVSMISEKFGKHFLPENATMSCRGVKIEEMKK